MKTTYIVVGLAVVAILGGIFWYISTAPSSTESGTNIAQGVIHEKGEIYTVDFAYPTTTPLAATAGASDDQAAVLLMQQWIGGEALDNFRNAVGDSLQLVAELKAKGEEVPASFQNLYLSSKYEFYEGAHTISYVFTTEEYTGGAHPNTTYKSFTFDSQSGAPLLISDVMTGSYLSVLSQKSRAYLLPHIAEAQNSSEAEVNKDMLNAGTTADQENFSNFYIDGDKLVLLFPPYQVGPYVLGTQMVPIPLADLKNSLKAAYR